MPTLKTPPSEDPNKTTAVDPKDVEENKVIAAIGYIWILCLVPLLLKKDSKFAQFHGKQGLVLFIAEVIISFIWVVPVLGWLAGFVGWIITLILAILGIVNALSGKYWRMPILGEYAEKLNL